MRLLALFIVLLGTGCGSGSERAFGATGADAAAVGASGSGGDSPTSPGAGGAPNIGAQEAGTAAQGGSTATQDAGTAPPTCTAGAVRCSGHQPQTCVGGVWLANGSLCAGALPACLDGVCVACTPGEHSCDGASQPKTCDASGTWALDTPCALPTPMCSGGVCAERCCDGIASGGGATAIVACSSSGVLPWRCSDNGNFDTCESTKYCGIGSSCSFVINSVAYSGTVQACP